MVLSHLVPLIDSYFLGHPKLVHSGQAGPNKLDDSHKILYRDADDLV